jgi:N6-L-threonylcarbamoyladenine synthase
MTILGIETSCDETAAAVVADGRLLLSNVVSTQIDLHNIYGGVVPEIAARSHIETIIPVIEKALEKAWPDSKDTWTNIDAIAVAYGPGLLGSLLIGVLTARTLAYVNNKPLYKVNHVEAHAIANMLLNPQPKFSMLGLIASGGHTQLVLFRDHFDYAVIGKTLDDAVGEAFDKVAKILGLNYPGGPAIEKAAENGNPEAFKFPKAKLSTRYDFSFSGLKTAVLRRTQELVNKDFSFPSYKIAALLSKKQVNDLAASFQKSAIESLVDKMLLVYKKHQPASVTIGGGVAANTELRKQIKQRIAKKVNYLDMSLCTDNAAMIATLGYYVSLYQKPADYMTLEVAPNLKM